MKFQEDIEEILEMLKYAVIATILVLLVAWLVEPIDWSSSSQAGEMNCYNSGRGIVCE